MFSTFLLCTLVGSVMGCWEKAGSAVNATRSTKASTLSANAGDKGGAPGDKGGAPSVCREGEERATQAKGHPLGYPPSPPPPKFLVLIELRRFCAQAAERVGVIWKILLNKELAVNIAD